METLSFCISNSDQRVPLSVECWLDNQLINYIPAVDQTINIKIPLPIVSAEHELTIILKNKLPEHTIIDQQGAIVQDTILTVDQWFVDTYDITSLVAEHAAYTHDFNGSQALATHKFFGTIGCNGTVSLKFTSPVYQWILANT